MEYKKLPVIFTDFVFMLSLVNVYCPIGFQVVLKENLVVTLFRDEVSSYQMICDKPFWLRLACIS